VRVPTRLRVRLRSNTNMGGHRRECGVDHWYHTMVVGRRAHVTRRPNDSISFCTRLVRHSRRSHRAGSSKIADLRQPDTCAPTASGVIRHQHVDLLGRRSAPLFPLPFAALTPSLPHLALQCFMLWRSSARHCLRYSEPPRINPGAVTMCSPVQILIMTTPTNSMLII